MGDYTPANTPHLFGHEEVETSLLQMIEQKRLPHTLLIAGPKGVGKATLSYRLARYLLAGESAGGDALFGPSDLSLPQENPIFARVSAGSHSDLMVIEPAYDAKKDMYKKEISVSDVRKVGHFLAHTPAESDRRIVIIDSADALNVNAANALLKSIEEPPANAVMMLISHQPGRLLPTIRSRCHRITMHCPDVSAFQKILQRSENDVSDEQIKALYALSDGSAGRALWLAEHDAIALYQELLEHIAKPNIQAHMALSEKLASKKNEALWPLILYVWQQMMSRIVSSFHQPNIKPIFAQEQPLLHSLQHKNDIETWLNIAEKTQSQQRTATGLHFDKQQTLLQSLQLAV